MIGVVLSGVKVAVGPPLSPHLQRVLINGNYESAERQLVEKHLRPWDSVLELGTGLGVIATLAAKKVGSHNVTTFEGNPQMIPLIEQTFRLNDVFPNLRHAILGDQQGEADFYLHDDFWISSTTPLVGAGEFKHVKVPMVSAQETLGWFKPTTLICDIEGGEADLFKTLDIHMVNKIILEVHPRVLTTNAIARLLTDFYAQGFRLIEEAGDVWMLLRQ